MEQLVYNDIWEEIKNTISLADEMEKDGIYLVKKNNGRKLFCVCPFHPDNAPSMIVNVDDDVETYHCFGCSASGSVVDYVMKSKGIGLLGALEYFSKNFPLEHSSEIDISKLIDRTIKKRKPVVVSTLMMKISRRVRNYLINSSDFKSDLMKLSPILQMADEAAYLENSEYLDKARKQIDKFFDEVKQYKSRKIVS